MTSTPELRRRALLLGGVALATALSPATFDRPVAFAAPAGKPQFFGDAEWRFVRAAIARLIPADETGPGALELGVAEFIDRQMQTPWAHGARWYLEAPFRETAPEFGYQLPYAPRELYRIGIAAADAAIHRDFAAPLAELDTAHQDAALAAMEAGHLQMPPIPSAIFFSQLLDNTREGFFSDPIHGGNHAMAGWKLIGFPGARGDYTDWVDRYGERYPFGPVSISDLARHV